MSDDTAPPFEDMETPGAIDEDAILKATLEEPTSGRRWRAFGRNKAAVIASTFLVVVLLVGVFAPLVATHDPNDATLSDRRTGVLTDGYLLGTDDIGRDMFSRVVYGTRTSLLAGLGTVVAALALALPIGMLAGYHQGWVDNAFMRFVDALLSIPPLILVFAIAGTLGPGLFNAVMALAIFFVPIFVRLIRGEVRSIRRSQLVEAELAVGVPTGYIMRRHILPVIAAPLIVQASLAVGTAILAETSLSFLGLGVMDPTASWGRILKQAFNDIQIRSWPLFLPGAAIASTVLAINVFGDGLRDALGRVEG
jgi:peptide/nickel transport system permease protein